MSSEGSEASRGNLYLVPNLLGDGDPDRALPPETRRIVHELSYYIAENPKAARAFLKRAGTLHPIQEIRIERMPEHADADALQRLLAPVLAGENAGLISDAGCPAVADPGAVVIREAHARKIRVIPLVGPSSILLAVMGSGLQGQRFAFHGYLPVQERDLLEKIRELETESARDEQTQLFIETPYRNERLLSHLLPTLKAGTLLCIATDLTLPTEQITTRRVSEWKSSPATPLKDRPSVFLILAEPAAARPKSVSTSGVNARKTSP